MYSGSFAMLKGKTNYRCDIDGFYSVDEAPCQYERDGDQIAECKEQGNCPYYKARELAQIASCSLLNFSAYLTWRMIGAKQDEPFFDQRELHVIDEAHRIEDCVIDFLALKISEPQIRKMFRRQMSVIGDMPREGDETAVLTYLKGVDEAINYRLAELAEEFDVSVELLAETAMESRSAEKKIMPTLNLQEKIANIFGEDNAVEDFALGFTHEAARGKFEGGNTVMAKPLMIGSYIRERVLGGHTLFMSATLPMTDSWAKNLGLTGYEIINIDSHFPAENRPIFFTTVGSMKKGGAERLVDLATRKILQIVEKFPAEKGIIHTPSYLYNGLLSQYLYDPRFLICKSGDDTEATLNKHCKTDQPTILVSPAMREGVDLKDSLSRFQIIVKAPFPSLGDPAIKKKMESNYHWYNQLVLTHFLQAYGRSVRSSTDYARTYILDDDLRDFLRKMRKEIPGYVLEAIHQL